MITASTNSASAMRPPRTGLGPIGIWATCAVAGLVALVALIGLPRDAAARYGSPVVAHVMTAGGRGGVYLTAHRDAAPERATALAGRTDARPGHAGTPYGPDRRGTSRLGSFADFGYGIVLTRSTRPLSQIAVVQSVIVLTERDHRIAASRSSRVDDFHCAAGQAHRLRGPPSLAA
jgi:hypothetical protein